MENDMATQQNFETLTDGAFSLSDSAAALAWLATGLGNHCRLCNRSVQRYLRRVSAPVSISSASSSSSPQAATSIHSHGVTVCGRVSGLVLSSLDVFNVYVALFSTTRGQFIPQTLSPSNVREFTPTLSINGPISFKCSTKWKRSKRIKRKGQCLILRCHSRVLQGPFLLLSRRSSAGLYKR